jgi:hypothetical protein
VAKIIPQVAGVLNLEPAEAELVWPKDRSAVHSIRIWGCALSGRHWHRSDQHHAPWRLE